MTKAIAPQDFVTDGSAAFEADAVLAKLARVSFFTNYMFGSLVLTAMAAVLAWVVIGNFAGSPQAPLAYAVLLGCYYLALKIRSDIWCWMARRRISKARRELGLPEDLTPLEELVPDEDLFLAKR